MEGAAHEVSGPGSRRAGGASALVLRTREERIDVVPDERARIGVRTRRSRRRGRDRAPSLARLARRFQRRIRCAPGWVHPLVGGCTADSTATSRGASCQLARSARIAPDPSPGPHRNSHVGRSQGRCIAGDATLLSDATSGMRAACTTKNGKRAACPTRRRTTRCQLASRGPEGPCAHQPKDARRRVCATVRVRRGDSNRGGNAASRTVQPAAATASQRAWSASFP
jgi:hypothetical protein